MYSSGVGWRILRRRRPLRKPEVNLGAKGPRSGRSAGKRLADALTLCAWPWRGAGSPCREDGAGRVWECGGRRDDPYGDGFPTGTPIGLSGSGLLSVK